MARIKCSPRPPPQTPVDKLGIKKQPRPRPVTRSKTKLQPPRPPSPPNAVVVEPAVVTPIALEFQDTDIGLVLCRNLPLQELVFVIPRNQLTDMEYAVISRWCKTSVEVGILRNRDPKIVRDEDKSLIVLSQALLARLGFGTFLHKSSPNAPLAKYSRPELRLVHIPWANLARVHFYV